jgi:hypothetical protein
MRKSELIRLLENADCGDVEVLVTTDSWSFMKLFEVEACLNLESSYDVTNKSDSAIILWAAQ